MPEQPSRKISLPKDVGMIPNLVNRIKLIARLLGDSRVSTWIKLIPIASGLYFLIPEGIPFIIDDAAVIWLATYLFVELCPPEIVEEHTRAIAGLPPAAAAPANGKTDEEVVEGEVIEGDFQDN